jgi:amino acid transporter/mannitol/fructose-specific phosphotransferase system IIA component (Ntr-type)
MASNGKKLKKSLGLFDVYAICTGAMFSSGFFLLPGLAAAQTGSSVALAYLLAGVMMLPAMFSMAELATAMPRAGGDYFFLDRAMGPLVGTVGGIGTYLALALKSAFALIGMGAYITLFVEIDDIRPLAVGLTLAFTALNILGAKETTGLQRLLVTVLVAVMGVFIAGGVISLFDMQQGAISSTFARDVFLTDGIAGLLGTVGFVFVSYAGLTKIASVSEEVQNPGRNIPLGMILSIISTTIIYVVGIVIMTAALDVDTFYASLTPVADTAREVMSFLPGELGVILIVASAVAAFASTGNAGIMAASRYPLAMGRDRLLPAPFAFISGQGTPVFSILITCGLMIFAIGVLDESTIAKVASTFQLMIFMLVNLAVIVMRESHIEYYDPVYRTPAYPLMQISGILVSLFLLSYIGTDALTLTLVVVSLCVLWYFLYSDKRVERHGAIFHWFSRLGERRYEGIEHELRDIMKEKGLRSDDPYSEVVVRASVIDIEESLPVEEVTQRAMRLFSQNEPIVLISDLQPFMDSIKDDITLIGDRAALPNMRLNSISHTEMVIVRSREGILVDGGGAVEDETEEREPRRVHAMFYLISPQESASQHLRIMALLVNHIEESSFVEDWMNATDWHELKEILLHSERILTLWLDPAHATAPLINQPLKALSLPPNTLVALIRRDNEEIIPQGGTVLKAGDQVVIIGDEASIDILYKEYVRESQSIRVVRRQVG